MAGLDDSLWISAAEAARLTGMSVRTIKRMAEEGQLKSSKTPGLHVRILRADVDKLLRPTGAASASNSASSVLAAKREEVETIGLDLQAERGRRELARFHQQDTEAERERKETRRSERLANKRTLAEIALERRRDTERREREQREAEALTVQADFERRWKNSATAQLPDWLTFEQQEIVSCAIDSTVRTHGPDDEQIMESTLRNVIRRLCAPWAAERQARAEREQLVEKTVRRLPSGATDAEKARAATDVRAALTLLPLTASGLEIQSAVAAVVDPVIKAIEQRGAVEEARAKEKQASEQAENEKARARQEAENEKARQARTRQVHKSWLVDDAVARVDVYLSELYADGEIDLDAYTDFSWRSELKDLVREELEVTLAGASDETREDAEEIAEQVVDEELE